MSENIFELAAREKVRFSVGNAVVAVESLYDLPLTKLDTLAKGLRREINEGQEESFIKRSNPKLKMLNLQFELVKAVIQYRLDKADAEASKAATAAQNAAMKEAAAKILADRQVAALGEKSDEELKALANG
jgi:hypothetical protein